MNRTAKRRIYSNELRIHALRFKPSENSRARQICLVMTHLDNLAGLTFNDEGRQHIVVHSKLPKIERTSLIRTFLKHPSKQDGSIRTFTLEELKDVATRCRERSEVKQ